MQSFENASSSGLSALLGESMLSDFLQEVLALAVLMERVMYS